MSSANLLGIPRELRDRIYYFVYPNWHLFVDEDNDDGREEENTIARKCTAETLIFLVPPKLLALFSVNRQISGEAAKSFYGTHNFVGMRYIMKKFFGVIAPHHRSLVSTVQILESSDSPPQLIQDAIGNLENLQRLRIELRDSRFVIKNLEERLMKLGVEGFMDRMEFIVKFQRREEKGNDGTLREAGISTMRSFTLGETGWKLTEPWEFVEWRRQLN